MALHWFLRMGSPAPSGRTMVSFWRDAMPREMAIRMSVPLADASTEVLNLSLRMREDSDEER